MNRPLKRGALRMGVGAIALLSAAGPGFAQDQPAPQHQQDLRRYEAQRQDYREDRADYATARRDYDRRLAEYSRARDAYDRRYGRGAYARRHGAEPAWDNARWAQAYGADASHADPACSNRNSARGATGGLIGALAGAALGSNLAASNARTEGAVLGGLVGGAVGFGVGRASAHCDDAGDYFAYDQTVEYREGPYYRGRSSGRHQYRHYSREGCRLAPASVEWRGETQYRYARVCPDRQGRYRLTG